MRSRRTAFALGRLGPARRIVWVRRPDPRCFPGPWHVAAVVGGEGPEGIADLPPVSLPVADGVQLRLV